MERLVGGGGIVEGLSVGGGRGRDSRAAGGLVMLHAEMLELFVKGANEFVWAAKCEPSDAKLHWEEQVSSTLARPSEHGAGGT